MPTLVYKVTYRKLNCNAYVAHVWKRSNFKKVKIIEGKGKNRKGGALDNLVASVVFTFLRDGVGNYHEKVMKDAVIKVYSTSMV